MTARSVRAGLRDAASLGAPDRIRPTEYPMPYSRDLTIDLESYSVTVVEIAME